MSIGNSNEDRWYVVHTYSGYENKVKTNLEKIIENRGIQDQIIEVKVPVEKSSKQIRTAYRKRPN